MFDGVIGWRQQQAVIGHKVWIDTCHSPNAPIYFQPLLRRKKPQPLSLQPPRWGLVAAVAIGQAPRFAAAAQQQMLGTGDGQVQALRAIGGAIGELARAGAGTQVQSIAGENRAHFGEDGVGLFGV